MGNNRRNRRKGATLVESTVVLVVFLTFMMGMFELALATIRYNAVATSARALCRAAVVRGELAAPEKEAWGPADFEGDAGDGTLQAASTAGKLPTMIPDDTHLKLTWPDGSNQVGDRVEATVSYQHQPLALWFLSADTFEVKAVSVMRIAH